MELIYDIKAKIHFGHQSNAPARIESVLLISSDEGSTRLFILNK